MLVGLYRRSFELDDLEGYGYLGLTRAVHKYAALQQDVREATDLAAFLEKRIWRGIETGRDNMSVVRRTYYRLIKRGQMTQLRFLRDGEYFCHADAITTNEWSESTAHDTRTEEMMAWLAQQNPVLAEVVTIHLHRKMTHEQIARVIGRTRSAVSSLYARALNLLRWKYNSQAYRPGNRNARRRLAPRRKASV